MSRSGKLEPFEKTSRRCTLTAKQVRFILGYWNEGLSATDAYLKYIAKKPDSLSRIDAGNAASAILGKKEAREYLREMQEEDFRVARITGNRLVAMVEAIAFADRTKMFNVDGSIKPPHEWPENLRLACDGVEIEERDGWIESPDGEPTRGVVGRKIKVRTGGAKLEALKLLMKFKKMIEKTETNEERQARSTQAHPPLVVVLEDDRPPVSQEPEPN